MEWKASWTLKRVRKVKVFPDPKKDFPQLTLNILGYATAEIPSRPELKVEIIETETEPNIEYQTTFIMTRKFTAH